MYCGRPFVYRTYIGRPFWHPIYNWTMAISGRRYWFPFWFCPDFATFSRSHFLSIKWKNQVKFFSRLGPILTFGFILKDLKGKNPSQQIATKPLRSLLWNQSLTNLLFYVNTLYPKSINIIIWWFQRPHKFHRRSQNRQDHIKMWAGSEVSIDLTMKSFIFPIAPVKWTIPEIPYSLLFLNLQQNIMCYHI